MKQPLSSFAKYSWGILAYNILVILWGAFVRATGSGAGCGAHWPLCNGVVIPRPQQIETVIEFTHRVTSGITLPLIIILFIWAWRKYPGRSPLRVSSTLAMIFTLTEALIGAWLVLFKLVADNDSVYRAVSIMAHLMNTFILLGSITITAWWATVGAPHKLSFHGITGVLFVGGALSILMIGASGAVTALGDTLYPSSSLSQGFQQDFSPTAHYLIRMRIYHPGIAVSVGIYLALVTTWIRKKMVDSRLEWITFGLFGLYGLQILLGILNVALLAPVWMQLIHLMTSTLVWIMFVLMATTVFSSAVSTSTVQDLSRLENHEVHDGVYQAKEVR